MLLLGVLLLGVSLLGVSLPGVLLLGVSLVGAKLGGVKLWGVKLLGVRLGGVWLSGVWLSSVWLPDDAPLHAASRTPTSKTTIRVMRRTLSGQIVASMLRARRPFAHPVDIRQIVESFIYRDAFLSRTRSVSLLDVNRGDSPSIPRETGLQRALGSFALSTEKDDSCAPRK